MPMQTSPYAQPMNLEDGTTALTPGMYHDPCLPSGQHVCEMFTPLHPVFKIG